MMPVKANLKNAPKISVEVFKTNVEEEKDAAFLISALCVHFTNIDVHFDLEDCDKILRIESQTDIRDEIISVLVDRGFCCEALT